jgi:CubicO group peptidase (beta-lactamase class C family)
VGELTVEVDPREAGFDARRLARVNGVLDRYIEDGRIPGWSLLVSRRGQVVHLHTSGRRHVEDGLPVETDTLFRIYSMTKPITSVAAMMLYEEGAFELNDPLSRYLPAFADARVFTGGTDLKATTVPTVEPVRVRHLLTHTAGLTYGFHRHDPVDAMMRAQGFDWAWPEGLDLATAVDAWAELPLLFQPGTSWNYSVATDVLGRLVEVLTGASLDDVFRTRILEPLGMADTGFSAAPEHADRLARLYLAAPGGGMAPGDQLGEYALRLPSLFSGGGGLVSTLADYHRFTQLLLRGGELDGVRLLGPRTLAMMTRNHLPGDADLDTFGRPLFAETPLCGVGFGLGFGVVLDPVRVGTLCSVGEFHWGGAASTFFWVDPAEQLTAIFLTQLLPSSTYPLRTQLRQTIYQALID